MENLEFHISSVGQLNKKANTQRYSKLGNRLTPKGPCGFACLPFDKLAFFYAQIIVPKSLCVNYFMLILHQQR